MPFGHRSSQIILLPLRLPGCLTPQIETQSNLLSSRSRRPRSEGLNVKPNYERPTLYPTTPISDPAVVVYAQGEQGHHKASVGRHASSGGQVSRSFYMRGCDNTAPRRPPVVQRRGLSITPTDIKLLSILIYHGPYILGSSVELGYHTNVEIVIS